MYALFTVIMCVASYAHAALDLHEFGISTLLTTITNKQATLILVSPSDSRLIKPGETYNTKVEITEKPITISGSLKSKPTAFVNTKAIIKQIDNVHIQGDFFYTNDFKKEIMPPKVTPVGFRYADLPLVYATSVVGHLDMTFYKTHNAVQVTIDEHGNGQLSIQRSGPWIGVFKHAKVSEPWKSMKVKKVINSQGKTIYEAQHKGRSASDEKIIDQLIANNKIEKVEVDYKKNELTLIVK